MTGCSRRCRLLIAVAGVLVCWPSAAAAHDVSVVVTSENLSQRLSLKPPLALSAGPPPPGAQLIQVDDSAQLQRFAGVGGAMTDSSAWLFSTLSPASRKLWMGTLFSARAGNLSFLRVPVGASDFTATGRAYTYDDLRHGRSDRRLRFFSILHDDWYVLPVLREALGQNRSLRVMASLWSAPAWMKLNHALDDENGAGMLRGDMYGPLARYLVKFLKAYARAGVPVSALTPQNEPAQNTAYPGGNLSEGAEASFIAAYLRPALAAAHLNTAIYGYDYDWSASLPPYAASLASGPAAPDLGGIAWHCYYGDPTVMSTLHQLDPGLDQVVSECAEGLRFFSTSELLIASFRNWATAVNLWNLALDPSGGPVQQPNEGCRGCTGILTIDPRTGNVQPTLDFYQLFQVSHFLVPGAVRLQSTTLVSPAYLYLATPGVDDVAFQNPDGEKVLIAYNSSAAPQAFTVQDGAGHFSYQLAPATTATFTW